jgi:quinol-cytochrome oxidoreductase complex cytochrome b subunit
MPIDKGADMKPTRRNILVILAGLFLVIVIVGTSAEASAISATHTTLVDTISSHASILRASVTSEVPVLPEKDSCLHCHLSGEITHLWVPLSRWIIFGAAGLIFAYGFYRSGSVWITRKRWTPIWIQVRDWLDERYQIVKPIREILEKPVELFATRWWYCLGGITFVLFIVQGITGVLLAFYYKPTPDEAYASIQFIETQVRFGAAIRAIHHWSANGMVVMVVAHLLRVFITGAFKPPRELNWISGVILFIVTLGFGFTGYLLPWDQRAFWATTVGSEIAGGIPWIGDLSLVFLRGGWDVGAVTLSRFYAVHVLVLPVIIIAFLGLHFLMIRRQGIARPL